MIVRRYCASDTRSVVRLVNATIRDWPYCRPIDADLLAHWSSLGPRLQTSRMLVARAGDNKKETGAVLGWLHGERLGPRHHVHLLAVARGADAVADALLSRIERDARRSGALRIVGPSHWGCAFYGGRLLGSEPYHPASADELTRAWIRNGFHVATSIVLLAHDLRPARRRASGGTRPPPRYRIVETAAPPEHDARTFRFAAMHGRYEVGNCIGRTYPGGLAQLGFVGVDEEHRGRGLARSMVIASLARARALGAGRAILCVSQDNHAALAAYEGAGFRRERYLIEWAKALQ